jgi:proteasome lid subunit RPN8/RPN11
MLKIKNDVLNKIIAHSRAELPIEACGYLAEKDGVINKHFELTNMDKSDEHFSMDPAEQFGAVRESRRIGMTIRAVYHSHPATPARPSEEDIKLAYDPLISYVIISLKEQEPMVRSFIIENGEVSNEEIVIV